jgi:Na+/H+ antiporter NhaD/arsenite permease-like protein
MELNPVPVLISLVIFSNIGGAVTPVGDPPNVIISNDKDVKEAGIDFLTFSSHMLLGIIPVMAISYIQLRLTFRSMKSLQFSEPYVVAGRKTMTFLSF